MTVTTIIIPFYLYSTFLNKVAKGFRKEEKKNKQLYILDDFFKEYMYLFMTCYYYLLFAD